MVVHVVDGLYHRETYSGLCLVLYEQSLKDFVRHDILYGVEVGLLTQISLNAVAYLPEVLGL